MLRIFLSCDNPLLSFVLIITVMVAGGCPPPHLMSNWKEVTSFFRLPKSLPSVWKKNLDVVGKRIKFVFSYTCLPFKWIVTELSLLWWCVCVAYLLVLSLWIPRFRFRSIIVLTQWMFYQEFNRNLVMFSRCKSKRFHTIL